VIEKTEKTPTVCPVLFGAQCEGMGQFDARVSRAAALGLNFSGEGLKFFIRAPLRGGATGARKDLFFSLPSASPFSAQARLGPRWLTCGRA